MIKYIGLVILCFFFSFPVYAEPAVPQASDPKPDEYIKPTWIDLLHTMVRFNAVDLSDDVFLDSYAAVTECDLYQFYYKDDFKWNQIRKTIRQSAELNEDKYPVHYHFDHELQLDRYDFQNKIYRLKERSQVKNVNLFRIYDVQGATCGSEAAQHVPKTFQAATDKVLNFTGLPLSPADAQTLLRQMEADNNSDRIIFMRVNMTVTYINRLHREFIDGGTSGHTAIYSQSKEWEPRLVRMDVHVDTVNFYEDSEETKLIYSIKPSS